MSGSILRRAALLVGCLCATPLALAQEAPQQEMNGFIVAIAGLGMLFVLGIIGISLFHDNRKRRERLALVERLVTAGHPVPPELMLEGPIPVPLPEERRRDMRRGITWLCWALGIAVAFYFLSGRQLRAVAWGWLPLILSLGSFLKAWLTAREIARGAVDGRR